MRKITALILIITLSINVYAQNRKIQKLLELYKNHQYIDAIEQGVKILNKEPDNPVALYVLGLSYYKEAIKRTKPADRMVRIKKAILFIQQAKRYSNNKIDTLFPTDLQAFHDTLVAWQNHYFNLKDRDNAKYFAESLIRLFQDTTDVYRQLTASKKPKEEQVSPEQSLIAQGELLNQTDALGRRQGWWIEKYPDGTIKYIIYFKDGHPAGEFKKYYQNGKLMADLKYTIDGKRAAAIFYDDMGHRIAMGYYYENKRDSLWQFFVNDSIVIMEINYKRGVKHGPQKIYSIYYYPNLLQERYYKNGKLDSIAVDYYFDGTPKAIYYYKNGTLDGPYTLLDYTGKVKIKGQYKNGYMEGLWTYYNPDGTQDTIHYHLGQPTNPQRLEAETKILKAMESAKGKYPEPVELFKKQFGLEGDW